MPASSRPPPSEIIQVLVEKTLDRARRPRRSRASCQLMKWCSQGHQAPGPHQRRHAGADRERHRLRRHRHRPHPHRAHVLRGRPHRRHARDDPRRQRRRPQEAALAKLLPYQQDDFVGIFKALKGFPATIRFLDPPLHEFLPARGRRAAGPRQEDGRARREDQTARQGTPRVQPDARLPRLPPRHRLSGNHRDAGPRRLRSRRRRARRPASR